MKIGIICNKKQDAENTEAKKLSGKIAAWLRERGHKAQERLSDDNFRGFDLVIILGGDGLILNVANRVSVFKVPLFRVNFGHRGFLANIEPEEIFDSLEKILKGDFHIEARNRIMVEIFHKNKMIKKMDALNDIAIGGIDRTVSLRMEVRQKNKIFSAETHGDGLIVSTKTGSTAYNINAGGAMLLVENVFSAVANNGFFRSEIIKMHIKSFVTADDSELKIEIINQNKLNLPYAVADGQRVCRLEKGDHLIIKKSPEKTLFLEIGGIKNKSF